MVRKVIELKRPQGKPLSRREAQRLINTLSKDSSNVRLSFHTKEQMAARDFVYNDILTILRDGIVSDEPESRGGKWAYKIRFHKFNDNRDAACVVGIDGGVKLAVVTVMWIDPGS